MKQIYVKTDIQMGNTILKRRSTLVITREMHVKTTMDVTSHPLETKQNHKCWQEYGKQELVCTHQEKQDRGSPKTENRNGIWCSNWTPGCVSKVMSNRWLHGHNYSSKFRTGNRWKQPQCPLMGEGTNRMWCTHTLQCYTTLRKRNPVRCFSVDGP